MPKVYARDPGAQIRVDNFGIATDSAPVEVPAVVLAELSSSPVLRVEVDIAPRRKAPKEEKEG